METLGTVMERAMGRPSHYLSSQSNRKVFIEHDWIFDSFYREYVERLEGRIAADDALLLGL